MIGEIIEMVNLTGGNDQKKIKDYKQLVSNIFKVYNFVLKLTDDGIMDHTQFRQNLLEYY
jgi:hypothetical protein